MYMFKMKNVCKPKLLRSSDMRNEIQKFADFIAVVYHHHHHDMLTSVGTINFVITTLLLCIDLTSLAWFRCLRSVFVHSL